MCYPLDGEVLSLSIAKLPLCREQHSVQTTVADKQPKTSMSSRIAPPRPPKSKLSLRSSADRPSPSAPVGGSEQAKKGERLSNYNKGAIPAPNRLRPLGSPPPVEFDVATSIGWTGVVVSPSLSGKNSRARQSAKSSHGSGATAAMATLLEEPGEPVDQARVKSKDSPKHRSKLLQRLNANAASVRPRTQSMPAGAVRPTAAAGDCRPPRDDQFHERMNAHDLAVTTSAVGLRNSNSAATLISEDGSLRGNSLPGVWNQKLVIPTDNDTSNGLLSLHPPIFCRSIVAAKLIY